MFVGTLLLLSFPFIVSAYKLRIAQSLTVLFVCKQYFLFYCFIVAGALQSFKLALQSPFQSVPFRICSAQLTATLKLTIPFFSFEAFCLTVGALVAL